MQERFNVNFIKANNIHTGNCHIKVLLPVVKTGMNIDV